MNLVELWLRVDPVRWIAGAFAGLFAGVLMVAASMFVAALLGAEIWFPVKIAAVPFLGASATEYGTALKPIVTGLIVHETICLVLGVIYAQVTATNYLPGLLGVGFVWGTFSWVFITNLFIQSFTEVFALSISPAAAFPVNLVFGLSLTSVAFFDRLLRGRA